MAHNHICPECGKEFVHDEPLCDTHMVDLGCDTCNSAVFDMVRFVIREFFGGPNGPRKKQASHSHHCTDCGKKWSCPRTLSKKSKKKAGCMEYFLNPRELIEQKGCRSCMDFTLVDSEEVCPNCGENKRDAIVLLGEAEGKLMNACRTCGFRFSEKRNTH